MEFLGVISTIMDLTQKEGEFSDELKTINSTFMSLQMAVSELGEDELPTHLRDMIKGHLNETQDLIKKTTTTKNWWKNIKYLLPGSDLHKLKEKNTQLLHVINLINLHVNSRKGANFLRLKTKSDSGYSEDLDDPDSTRKLKKERSDLAVSATIQDPVEDSRAISATIQDTQIDGDEEEEEEEKETAFRLVFFYDKKTYEQSVKNAEKLHRLDRPWDGDKAEYSIDREPLMYLPEQVCGRLSKNHAEIRAQRPKSSVSKSRTRTMEELALKATLQDDESEENTTGTSQSEAPLFELIDKSTNGTFILKNHSYGRINGPVETITGEFKSIKKGNKVMLQHGDIVGLVMVKPALKETIFGFQFLCEGL